MTDFLCPPARRPRGRLGRQRRAADQRASRLGLAASRISGGRAGGAPRAAGVGAEDLAGASRQDARARDVHPAGAASHQGQERLLRRRAGGPRPRRRGRLAARIGRRGARRPPTADQLAPHQPDEEGQEREVEQPDERHAAGLPSSWAAAVIGRRRCRSRRRRHPWSRGNAGAVGRPPAAPPRADPAPAPATCRRPGPRRRSD